MLIIVERMSIRTYSVLIRGLIFSSGLKILRTVTILVTFRSLMTSVNSKLDTCTSVVTQTIQLESLISRKSSPKILCLSQDIIVHV